MSFEQSLEGPLPGPDVAQSASHEGDRLFHLFADSIDQLAWIAQADGWIYWYNRNWYAYTGTTPEQMEGWGWQRVHDPQTLEDVLVKWRACIATGIPFSMVFPLRGQDGAFRPFLTRGNPLKDADGKVLRWFGTNTDISQEMGAAAALRQSEARFRTAHQALDAVLWTNNGRGEMTGEQPGWSSFTGQTQDQYQGYGWSKAVHPDDAQPTIDTWEIAVRNRSLFSFEHRVKRHDGLYRLCSVRALPILDANGETTEWVGVHTDITEQRETERTLREAVAALHQQQELLESAEVVSQVGFWRHRPGSSSIYLSAGVRHLLGLPLQDDVDLEQTVARVHPDDRAAIRTAMQDALSSGRYNVEFRTLPIAPEGEVRWISGVAQTVQAGEGPYLVGMNLDITQQKRSAEALIRTEKLAVAGRLAASIAHEINNPLEAITNLVYLLRTTELNEEQARMAATLESEIARVSHIATNTLRFHRQSVRPSSFEASGLLDSVLALYEGRLRNCEIAVVLRLPPSQPLYGLEGDLRQVLANLVGNAIDAMQAMPQPRTLYLRTCAATHPVSGMRGVRITVADRGSGIDPAHFARIYDPFFTTKAETGTGLGLWVSFEILTKHHGSLRVRSSRRPETRGTVFQLFLPNRS